MRVNMVIASSDSVACRIFIGCTDVANEFGAWLQLQGWHVRIEGDIDPRTQPRIREEEEMAAALTAEYDKWLGANR
jgi:hypothetical protein